jgi:hypothetical protein
MLRSTQSVPLTPEGEASLADALAAALGHRVTLCFAYCDAFPRGPGEKFATWWA